MKYKVKVIEEHVGFVTVEAESLDDAERLALFSAVNTEFESVIDVFAVQESLIKSSLAHEKGLTVLAKLERMVLVEVLRKFNGNQTYSAQDLRMSRTTLENRIKEHDIVLDYK